MLGLRIGVGVQGSQLRFSGSGEFVKQGEENQCHRTNFDLGKGNEGN